jgi:TRAP-type C4-dicarboxylate transport system permease small subunit
MALILVNILMRKLFNMPIMGTFELVGLLTATGLGFSLANCEMNNGNVAMSIITDKLPPKIQRVIEIMVFLISLIFWVLVAMRIFSNGSASLKSGWVSSTASLPIYPFIFLMFFNVFCLCLVLALKLTDSFCGAVVLFGKGKVSK